MYWLFQPSGVVNDWWYNLSLNFKKKKHFKQRFHEFQRFRNCAWQPSKYVIIWNIFFYSSLKNDVFMFSVKSFCFLFFSRFLHNNNLLNNLFFIYKKKRFELKTMKIDRTIYFEFINVKWKRYSNKSIQTQTISKALTSVWKFDWLICRTNIKLIYSTWVRFFIKNFIKFTDTFLQ